MNQQKIRGVLGSLLGGTVAACVVDVLVILTIGEMVFSFAVGVFVLWFVAMAIWRYVL